MSFLHLRLSHDRDLTQARCSDIDIVVDSSTVYARTPQRFFYGLIAQLVREGICRESEVDKVFHARVPIIKIKTIQGKRSVRACIQEAHLIPIQGGSR